MLLSLARAVIKTFAAIIVGTGIVALAAVAYALLVLMFPLLIIGMMSERMSLEDMASTVYDTYAGLPLDAAKIVCNVCVNFIVSKMTS